MNTLYPAKYIKKTEFSGYLLIDGNLQDNCILFRFLFDKSEMVHPLIISIKALPLNSPENCSKEKIMEYNCNIIDLNNPVMKTQILLPEFPIKDHRVEVISVESQVSCHIFCENEENLVDFYEK